MDQLIIQGNCKLKGEVMINGAKNAACAIIPAAILSNDICVIENVPHIEDVISLVEVMNEIGVKTEFINKNTLKIDSRNMINICVNYEPVTKIRSSYYLLGALLGRFNKAEVAFPGGCNFGTRPIDLHIKGFEALGSKVNLEHGIIDVSAKELVGSNIYLDVASVGATINIMLAAVKSKGLTTIENAAKEPHIVDTANFLNSMGANIKGAGTDIIKVAGVETLKGSTYTIVPDQIEAGTYMVAGAITCGDVTVKNVIPKHMEAISAKLIEMGVEVIEGDEEIRVVVNKPLKNIKLKTLFYPGFPTDMQPQMAVLLSVVEGTSIITEGIFENRFQYVDEIKRMGAIIEVEGRVAVIEGIKQFSGAEVKATDLRAGAGMVLAGLVANGETIVNNVHYVDRGYEDIEKKLNAMGANITRISLQEDN